MFHAFCICFIWMLHILQWLYTCVTSVCFKNFSSFKRMLQVFHLDVAYVPVAIHVCCNCVFKMYQLFHMDIACFYLDVAYVAVVIYTYIASVYPKCFTYFRRMLQVFYLDVVISCSGYTHMLQMYVSIVLPSFSMLQQVLLPTHSDSRARTRCIHPFSDAYLYHVGHL
jgi:hypothetical protein